jgi:hypothetical protein
MKEEDLYSEIVRQLEQRTDAKLAPMEKCCHKASGHKSYGIRIPELREHIKKIQDQFQSKLLLGTLF